MLSALCKNSESRKLRSADLIAFAHEKREKAKKLREEKDAEDVIAARNKFIAHLTENQAKLKQRFLITWKVISGPGLMYQCGTMTTPMILTTKK